MCPATRGPKSGFLLKDHSHSPSLGSHWLPKGFQFIGEFFSRHLARWDRSEDPACREGPCANCDEPRSDKRARRSRFGRAVGGKVARMGETTTSVPLAMACVQGARNSFSSSASSSNGAGHPNWMWWSRLGLLRRWEKRPEVWIPWRPWRESIPWPEMGSRQGRKGRQGLEVGGFSKSLTRCSMFPLKSSSVKSIKVPSFREPRMESGVGELA